MFFSKAFGVTASEFFEKSIDRHRSMLKTALSGSAVERLSVDGLVFSVLREGYGGRPNQYKTKEASGFVLPQGAERRRHVAF